MKDRRLYRLKENPKAFFYPQDWVKFFNALKEQQQPYFMIAVNTGGRIEEIQKMRVKDINFQRLSLTFLHTKQKAKKKETRPMPRTIKISSEFAQWLQRWIRRNNLNAWNTFNIPTTPGVNQLIKRKTEKLGFEYHQDYSSHNIRKTHGQWLKALGVDGAEICLRLGHDYNTFLSSYASADLFSESDRILIRQILGDLVSYVPSQKYPSHSLGNALSTNI